MCIYFKVDWRDKNRQYAITDTVQVYTRIQGEPRYLAFFGRLGRRNHQPFTDGVRCRLHPVLQVQLLQDVVEVVLNRPLQRPLVPIRGNLDTKNGGACGIRTRDLRLERAASWAARRMRHGDWLRN